MPKLPARVYAWVPSGSADDEEARALPVIMKSVGDAGALRAALVELGLDAGDRNAEAHLLALRRALVGRDVVVEQVLEARARWPL